MTEQYRPTYEPGAFVPWVPSAEDKARQAEALAKIKERKAE